MNNPWNIPQTEPGQTSEFGRQVVEWCRTLPERRPSTVGEVIDQLSRRNITIVFPEAKYSTDSPVRFVESAPDEWVVHLPPAELAQDALQRIRDKRGYPVEYLPTFFRAYLDHERQYDENFFHARLADFAIMQGA